MLHPRLHFDIYAIFEGPQELYFGHEVQVNVNLVETKLSTKDGRSLENVIFHQRNGEGRTTLLALGTC